jgi:membrane protein
MKAADNLKQSLENFLSAPGKELGRWARFVQFQIQLWRFCARRLWENNVTAMSSALSFRTIFAMIPLLVLSFLILKSVGVLEDRKDSLRQLLEASGFTQITLTQNIEPDSTEPQVASQPQQAKVINVADEIEKLVGHIESKLTLGRIGPIGIVLLIWTALTLLTEMELSLNRIFGARRGRSLVRRMLLYWSVMTLTPIAIVALTFVGQKAVDTLQNASTLSWLMALIGWIGPFIGGVLVLAALYMMIPNTSVQYSSAFGGALVAFPLWLIAKWGFAIYVRECVATGNLYGALGLIPLFLIWLNLSWLIFLFGAELAHTAVNLAQLQSHEKAKHLVLGPADLLAAAIAVVQPHLEGRGPAPLDQIIKRLQLPVESVNWLLDRLYSLGLICPVEGDPQGAYVPARSAARIPVLEVLEFHKTDQSNTNFPYDDQITAIITQVQQQARSAMGSLTLANLASNEHTKGVSNE